MGVLPVLRRQNKGHAASVNGTEGFPAVLPEMQADGNRQCPKSRSKNRQLEPVVLRRACPKA